MYKRIFFTTGDLIYGLTKTNSSRMHLVEKLVTTILFRDILKVNMFLKNNLGDPIKDYFKKHIKENNKLSFSIFNPNGYSKIYDPNYIRLEIGSIEAFYNRIKNLIPSKILTDQIRQVFDGYQNFNVTSRFSYNRGTIDNTDEFNYLDPAQPTTALVTSGPFMRKKYISKGVWALEFNVWGFKEFKNLLSMNLFDIYKNILKDVFKNKNFVNEGQKYFLWDEYNGKSELYDLEEDIMKGLTNSDTDEYFGEISVKNPYFESFKNSKKSKVGLSGMIPKCHSLLKNLRHDKFFEIDNNINKLSELVHYEKIGMSIGQRYKEILSSYSSGDIINRKRTRSGSVPCYSDDDEDKDKDAEMVDDDEEEEEGESESEEEEEKVEESPPKKKRKISNN